MATNDFNLSFGSNIIPFRREIKGHLAGVLEDVKVFQAELNKIGSNPKTSDLTRLLTQVAQSRGAVPATGHAAPGAGGGLDFQQMARDAASWNADVGNMVERMGVLLRGMETFERRSQSNRRTADTQPRIPAGQPGAGRYAPPDKTRTVTSASLREVRSPRPTATPTATISGTSRAVIDDAAVNRIVGSVDRGVEATQRVFRAINRLTQVVGGRQALRGGDGQRAARALQTRVQTDESIDPARDAAFSRVSQIRSQIAQRQRLTALGQLQASVGRGEKPGASLVRAAAGGSDKFLLDLQSGKTARIKKAMDALRADLRDVPKLRQLESELAEAIIATGTSEGKRTGAYRQVATERQQGRQDARQAARQAQGATAPIQRSVAEIRAQRDQSIQALQATLPILQAARAALQAKGGDASKLSAVEAQIHGIEQEIERLAKPLARERSAANRQASRQRQPGLSAEERNNQLTNLALPGDEELFRDMVRRRDLRRPDLEKIANTFTQQGYSTPFNSRTRNPELVESILGSRKSYEQAGFAQAVPLGQPGGNKVSTNVRKEVRKYISDVLKSIKLTVEEEAALETLQKDRDTGGSGTATQSRSGKAKRAQFPVRGGAFGGERDDLVVQAEQTNRNRLDRVTEAAIRKAGALVHQQPDFNPYDPRLRAGIQGTGPEAREARQALNKLTRAIEAWDRRNDPAALGAGSPIRAGIEQRRQAREAFDAERAQREEQLRAARYARADIRESASTALFGGTTGLGNQGFTRLFPGLRENSRLGRLEPTDFRTSRDLYATRQRQLLGGREGPLADDAVRQFNPDDMRVVNKSFNRYIHAFHAMRRLTERGGSPEELEAATIEMKRNMTRFIESYERAAHTQLRTADTQHVDHQGYDPALGYGKTETFREYTLAGQHDSVLRDRALDAKARAERRKLGADPKNIRASLKNTQQFLKLLGRLEVQPGHGGGLFNDPRNPAANVGIQDLAKQFDALVSPYVRELDTLIKRAQRNLAKAQADGKQHLIDKHSATLERLSGIRSSLSAEPRTPQQIAYDEAVSTARNLREAADKRVLAREGNKPSELEQRAEQEHAFSTYAVPFGGRPAGLGQAAQLAGVQRAAEAFRAAQAAALQEARRRRGLQIGGAGGEPPVTGGGGTGTGASGEGRGGSQVGVLRQILAELVAIHGTLRSGIKVTAKTPATSAPRASVGPELGGLFGQRAKRTTSRTGIGPEFGGVLEPTQTNRGQRAQALLDQARAQRQATAAAEKDEVAARKQARAKLFLDDIYKRLSGDAIREVHNLRDLISTGASAERVVQAQANAYRILDQELQRSGLLEPKRRQAISSVFRGDETRPVGAPAKGSELQDIRRSLTQGEGDLRQQGTNLGGVLGNSMADETSNAFQRALFGGSGVFARILHSTGTFLIRNFSAGLVFGLTNAISDAVGQGIETESTFVRVSEALDKTGRSSSGLRTELQGLSEDYGVALKDVYTTAAGLTGLFDRSDVGNQQLVNLTEVALQMQLISGGALNATEAMRSLASVTSAYGDTAPDHIADVATTIQNLLSVNIEDTIEGVARLSGQTKQLGIDFEHAAVYVAAISKFTNQTGAGAGEQFSRILESIQKGPTQKVISQALATKGIDVRGAFNARNYQVAIDTLLGSYGSLSKAEKDRVATQIGGARQAAAINGLLIEGGRVLDTVTASYHSNGAAQERATKISDQLANKMQRLRAAFVNFFAVLVRSGVLDALGVVLGLALTALDGINKALSIMNDLIDSSPITRALTHWALIVAGLSLGFVAARKAAAGFAGVIGALQARGAVAGAATVGAAAIPEGAVATTGGRAAGQAGLLSLLLGRRRQAEGFTSDEAAYARERARMATFSGLRTRGGVAQEGPLLPPRAYESSPAIVPGPNGRPYFYPGGTVPGSPYEPTGRGFSQRVYARAGGVFDRVGSSLESRAAAIKSLGAERLAAGRTGSALGLGLASYGVAGIGKVSGKLADGMEGMSRNVRVANFAMLGLAIGLGTLISTYAYNKQMTDKLSEAYKQTFGEVKKTPTSPTRAQQGEQTFQAIIDANKEAYAPGGGAIGSVLTSPSAIALNLRAGLSQIFGSGDAFDRAAGVTNRNQDIAFHEKPLRDVFGGFVDIDKTGHEAKRDPFGNSLDVVKRVHREGRLEKLGDRVRDGIATIGDVDKVVAANNKELADKAKEIIDSDASNAQKAYLLQDLSRIQELANSTSASFRLSALGLNRLDALTQDQLDAIGPMVTALSSFGTHADKEFAPLIQSYLNDIGGFEEGSTFNKLLGRLSAGGTTRYSTRLVPNRGVQGLIASGQLGNPAQQVDDGRRTLSFPTTPVVTPHFTPLTQDQRSQLGIRVLRTAIRSAQSTIATLPPGEEKTQMIQSAINLIGSLDQIISTRLQRAAADAQALMDRDRITGNFSGAAAGAAAAIDAARQQFKHNEITRTQLLDQIAQVNAQAAQDRVTAATRDFELAKSSTRNSISQASLELQSANAAYNALQGGGSAADILQAAIRRNQASLALADAQSEERLAALTTELTRATAPGDAVAQARARLQIALATQSDAATRFTTDSTQYQQAAQGVIEAQRGIDQALRDVAEANSSLAIAYATAGGHSVRAAQIALRAAKRKLQEALDTSGGNTNSAEVINAQAAVVQAQAAARDAGFQSTLDTINFNQQMGYASQTATVAALQNLLRLKDLTRDQRRQVLLQIHQIQQDLVGELTSSGFNIPSLGDVKLPTPYEVRRSIGLDKIQHTLRDAVLNSEGGLSLNAMRQQQGTSSITGSSGDLVSAINSVTDAVRANGSTKVNVRQENTFNTPSRQAAREIAHEVIEILNRQGGQKARASTSTPRTVPTR